MLLKSLESKGEEAVKINSFLAIWTAAKDVEEIAHKFKVSKALVYKVRRLQAQNAKILKQLVARARENQRKSQGEKKKILAIINSNS